MSRMSSAGTIGQKVFNQIESAILEGKYTDGEALTELGLSKEYGVSRTPVREALRQLERENLVEIVANKGAVVKGISEKDVKDIYEIRMIIERLAAERAAAGISKEHLSELEETVEFQEFFAKKNKPEKVWELDEKFHTIIFDASDSRLLKSVLRMFHKYIGKAREISIKTEGRMKESLLEHRGIFEAIAARNCEQAGLLTQKHIENARKNILSKK